MDISLLPAQLNDYLECLVPSRPPGLQAMEDEAARDDFPIIGPVPAHFCYLVARMIQARRVFELGSGFGYSTAWFARAVRENGGGEVHHVVWEDALSLQARRRLAALGYGENLVHYHVGEAVETLRQVQGEFDLVFNDIEKEDYPASLPVIERKLRPGGVLIIDNMIWSGRIFDPADKAASTEGIRRVTEMLTRSPAWVSSIIPLRDGLILAFKT